MISTTLSVEEELASLGLGLPKDERAVWLPKDEGTETELIEVSSEVAEVFERVYARFAPSGITKLTFVRAALRAGLAGLIGSVSNRSGLIGQVKAECDSAWKRCHTEEQFAAVERAERRRIDDLLDLRAEVQAL